MGGVWLKGWTLDADGTGKGRKPGGSADGGKNQYSRKVMGVRKDKEVKL